MKRRIVLNSIIKTPRALTKALIIVPKNMSINKSSEHTLSQIAPTRSITKKIIALTKARIMQVQNPAHSEEAGLAWTGCDFLVFLVVALWLLWVRGCCPLCDVDAFVLTSWLISLESFIFFQVLQDFMIGSFKLVLPFEAYIAHTISNQL